MNDVISGFIEKVGGENLKNHLFYLAKDPLPYRKVDYTVPGHSKSTLDETDDFVRGKLEECGYTVERESVKVRVFGRDISKPKSQQFAPPPPDFPYYTAYNLYAKKKGTVYPGKIIVIVSHKDSPSWVDSPGAHDNAVGTVANLEIARILKDYQPKHSMWFLFCNEEHTPWTSVTAANKSRERGDDLIAIFNLDGLAGKSKEENDCGRKTNVILYTKHKGKKIADVAMRVNSEYNFGLVQKEFKRENPGDDDGSFIRAGYHAAVAMIGSYPYANPDYHSEGDTPESVDLVNLTLSAKLTLATVLNVDMSWR